MATTKNWTLEVYDGASWISSDTLPNPGNKSVEVPKTSTHKVYDLVDGSRGFVTPQTKFTNGGIEFEITEYSSSTSIISQINNYVENHYKVTITDHVGNTVTGYFDSMRKIMTLSGRTQRYVLVCSFIPV